MDRQAPTPRVTSHPSPDRDTILALERKIDEQQRLIDDLERRLERQNQQMNTLSSRRESAISSPGSSLVHDVGALRAQIIMLIDDHQQTESDVSTLMINKDEVREQVAQIIRSQEQTNSSLAVLEQEQNEIRKNNEEVQNWQKQVAKHVSEKESVEDKVLVKVDKTKVLAKELQHIIKGELQERSKVHAGFSLLQYLELKNDLPVKIDNYGSVQMPSIFFDNKTGNYTVPIRGKYQVDIKIYTSGKGSMLLYLCASDGTRHEVTMVNPYTTEKQSLTCTCTKDEKMWLEVQRQGGTEKAWVNNCRFQIELLPDQDEEEDKDKKKDDDNAKDSGDGGNVTDLMAALIALDALMKSQR